MNTISLKIDDTFEWCGSNFYVHDIQSPNVFIFKEDGQRKIIRINYLSLISDPTFKCYNRQAVRADQKQEVNRRALLDTLPEEIKKVVEKRFSMVAPILLYDEARTGNMYAAQSFNERFSDFFKQGENLKSLKRGTLIERIAEKFKFSERQIHRYLKKYRETEAEQEKHGIEGLVSKPHLGGRTRIDEIAIQISHPKKSDIVLDTIYVRMDQSYGPILKKELGKFLSKRRRNISSLTESLEIACTAVNLPVLGYDTVYKIVNRIDKYVMERINKGDVVDPQLIKDKASNQFALAPLHVIEIDHVKLPITLIDPETGAELGEPWLSLGMCVFSRMVWGIDLSFDGPSGNKVMRVLLNGILLKNAKEKYKTINDWEMHGIPTVIYMDNGSDFTSAYVKRMIQDVLGAEYRYRPIATPRYGGIIERYFGTINTAFLERLLGNRLKKSSDNEERKQARTEAILSLENLRELLINYIVDVYHHSEHDGLPLDCNTPVARLYNAMDTMGTLPFIPVEEEEYYRIQLLPTEDKSYRRNGIRLGNAIYASSETSKYISRTQKKNVKIKYCDNDISKIYVLDTEKKEYIEVPSISPPCEEVQGMSRKEYQIIRKHLIEKGRLARQEIPGSLKISEGKLLIREKYNKMVEKNAPARRRALQQGFKLQVQSPVDDKKKNQNVVSKLEQLVARLNIERIEE